MANELFSVSGVGVRVVPGSELVKTIQTGSISIHNSVAEHGPNFHIGVRGESVYSSGYKVCTGLLVATQDNVLMTHHNARKYFYRNKVDSEMSQLDKMAGLLRGGEAVIWTRNDGDPNSITDQANKFWVERFISILTKNHIYGSVLTLTNWNWELSAYYFESLLNLTTVDCNMDNFNSMRIDKF